MIQTIEVEHCGNDHLEPIWSIHTKPILGFPKPKRGGLWTSPIYSENSWRKWCEREDFHLERLNKSFRLEIDTSNLLIINSLDDLTQKMVHPHIMELDPSGFPYINWERLVNLYNGIWLTARGEAETRYSHPYSLYGWDCETIFLFNEKPIIKIRENENHTRNRRLAS